MRIEADDPSGDWAAPGVYEVDPGVYRIPLPLPHDGLKAVNVYALRDGEGLVLVDSGWSIAEARALLDKSLAALGHGLGDVRRFLVTHVHRDHYTLAVQLAEARAPGSEFRWFRPAELAAIPLSTTARKALRLAKVL